MVWSQILTSVLSAVAIAVAAWIAQAINSWSKATQEKMAQEKENIVLQEALTAIEIGVAKTQKEFVEHIKEVSKDGKLTKDEIKEAKRIAKTNALQVAAQVAPAAAALLIKMSVSVIEGIIEMFVGKQSKKE